MKTNKRTTISVLFLVFTLMMGTACGKNEAANGSSSNNAPAKQEKIEKMTDKEYATWYKGYLKRFEDRIMPFFISLVPMDGVYDKEWASELEKKIDSLQELLSEAKENENKVPDTYKKVNNYLVNTDDKLEPIFKDILKVTKQDKVVGDDLNFIDARMKKALEEMALAKTEVSKIENEKAKDESKS